jgi:hypothetical protein
MPLLDVVVTIDAAKLRLLDFYPHRPIVLRNMGFDNSCGWCWHRQLNAINGCEIADTVMSFLKQLDQIVGIGRCNVVALRINHDENFDFRRIRHD